MKLIYALLLLASLKAFAGPEDHMANQVCYDLQKKAGDHVPSEIPIQVCLESIQIDVNLQKPYVDSYFQRQLFANLKVKTLIRQTEDFYKYELTGEFLNEWNSGCGDGKTATLAISGMADFNGQIDPSNLNLKVSYEYTNDTCHSYPQESEYSYELR